MAKRGNPYHKPAGGPDGGEFTSGPGGRLQREKLLGSNLPGNKFQHTFPIQRFEKDAAVAAAIKRNASGLSTGDKTSDAAVKSESWRFNLSESKAAAAKMSDAKLKKEFSHHLNYVPGSSHLRVMGNEMKKRGMKS